MITYQDLEKSITQWAADRLDIRAVIVIGSRGQKSAQVDLNSDLDLVIFTNQPALYEEVSDWIAAFGEIWIDVRNRTGRGDREWMVLFSGGIKADLLIAKTEAGQGLKEILEGSIYLDVFQRGFRVLVDKTAANPGERPHLSAAETLKAPTGLEFELGVNRLLLAVARAANFVRRGDLWRGQRQINGAVNQALLVLIEWHAGLRGSGKDDIWYQGRFIEKWADPGVVNTLPDLFARYDREDMVRAMMTTIDLAEWLSVEIARSLDLTFPKPGQLKAISWIRESLG